MRRFSYLLVTPVAVFLLHACAANRPAVANLNTAQTDTGRLGIANKSVLADSSANKKSGFSVGKKRYEIKTPSNSKSKPGTGKKIDSVDPLTRKDF